MMDTLFDRMTDFESLYIAYRRARQGKRLQPEVAVFECNLETELCALQDELREGTYHPGRYRSFYKTEAKRRLISAAPFRDRVVHHALVSAMEPDFERRFIFDSYANRVGKGTHRALDRCTHFMRASRYLLPCDVRQFFPSIDHVILRAQLGRVVQDRQVLALVDSILAAGVGVLDEMYSMAWFPGDDLLAAVRPRGLPLGNLTSQFWANVYLNSLDQFVKRELKCRRYLRYVDDFALFSDRKAELNAWLCAIEEFLAGLRLTLHTETAQARPVQAGFPFLGFIVFPDHRRLKPARGHAFRRRFSALAQQYRRGEIPLERVRAVVAGWLGHVVHGDTYGLRAKILGEVIL